MWRDSARNTPSVHFVNRVMDERRWTNLCATRAAYEGGAGKSGAGPLEAFIEVSALCNLRCRMCAINVDRRYRPSAGRPELLTPELLERLSTMLETTIRCYLFGLGEPLLNPRLVDYVAACSAAGCEVWFNTNATLIDQGMADRLADAGADAITVSIDGATAATYQAIRRGASFDRVIAGIRALVDAGRRIGRPSIDVSFVAMAGNFAELPGLIDLCADLGVESVHVEPLYSQREEHLSAHYSRENLGVLKTGEVDRILEAAVERSLATGVRLSSRFVAERVDPDYVKRSRVEQPWWRCSEPWTAVWITSAGEVRCCCLNDSSFGSLVEQPFEAIWNGAAFREFRRAHHPGKVPPSCANCRRNSRTRCSPYLRAVRPITYRPVLGPAEPLRSNDSGPRLDWPPPDGLIGDPLPVTGDCGASVDGHDLEVLIDETVVADLGRHGVIEDAHFAVSVPVPFLSEGAHLLWLRPRGELGHPGWCRRHVHFWRPDGDRSLASGLTIVSMPRTRPWRRRTPVIEIGSRRPRAHVLRERRGFGVYRAALVDLRDVPTGSQALTARLDGEVVEEREVLVR
jgi:MoaA/NifB/PqqE/SkfB family radical SAM enzyme